jgi:hypothetical protein
MIPEGLGRWAGAFALAAAMCACFPSASAAQTWGPETWLSAAASSDGGAGAFQSSGASVLRLAESERQPPAVPTRRGPVIRRMRPNTISLGFQAQYGGLRGTSRLADGFDQGLGYAFRFRYMLGPKTALGFSFEHQQFGAIQPPLNVEGQFADSHLVVSTVSAEVIFFHHREKELHPYFLIGFGYASPDIIYTEDIAARANEGVFLSGGMGFERFIRPRFSIDGSLRIYGEIANSEFTSMGQVGLGIHVYPGD